MDILERWFMGIGPMGYCGDFLGSTHGKLWSACIVFHTLNLFMIVQESLGEGGPTGSRSTITEVYRVAGSRCRPGSYIRYEHLAGILYHGCLDTRVSDHVSL